MKENLKETTCLVLLLFIAQPVASGSVCSKNNSLYTNSNLKSSGTSGKITSPNFPSNYPNNIDCTWVISVPAGHHIELAFTTFNLQPALFLSCSDYVDIRDGPSSTSKKLEAGKFCGTRSGMTLQSTGNEVRIRFHSDGWVSYQGFSLSYTANKSSLGGGVIAGIVCGVVIAIIIGIVICVVCTKKNGPTGVVSPTQNQHTTTTTAATTVVYSQQSQQVQFLQNPQPQVHIIQASNQPPPYQGQGWANQPSQQAHFAQQSQPPPQYQMPGAPNTKVSHLPSPPPEF